MNLTSGRPFWSTKNGLLQTYPRLQESISADVVVLGAGITGSLIADRLASDGHRVVVVDRRDVGLGSTSASTALLQYEIDTPLHQLIQKYGEEAGVAAYRACLDAIGEIASVDKSLGNPGCFEHRGSFYFASDRQQLPELVTEFECRRAWGFPVEYWNESEIGNAFDFTACGGIYSQRAGQLDPYRLTHALLQRVRGCGGQVFDRTVVKSAEWSGNRILLQAEGEHTLDARWAIVAMGYESQTFLPKPVARLHNTFAFVSEPVNDFPGWYQSCQIWETARPYLYLRTTDDQRILAGGGDVPFRSPAIREALIEQKVAKIAARVREMFPRIRVDVDHAWGGTFAETEDGLPFIGAHPERPGLLFALCYGGNGVTYSMIASSILSEIIHGHTHPLQGLFGFARIR